MIPPPFGFGVGDFVVISKLIYRITLELKKNSEAAADYQLLLIELEALDRTLKCLERIEPAHHERRRLDGIRALAATCQLPLQEFLEKIEKFEGSLGPWNNKRSLSAITQRVRWSTKYKDEAQALRARLAPNLATITVLLMTQTVDTLSHAEPHRSEQAKGLNDKLVSQSRILAAIQDSSDHIAIKQAELTAQNADLAAAVATQDRNFQTLASKADEILKSNAQCDRQLRDQASILKDIQETSTNSCARTQESIKLAAEIHHDTVEMKTTISSLLGRALDLMEAVMAGISRLQDITTLMHQMINLAASFTIDMRETMVKLLHAFWTLQKQLARMECFMHRRICPPIVIFRDAFNIMRSLPYDLSREWRTFRQLVTVAFTGRQGLHRVNMGQYFVTNARIGRRLNPAFWSHAVEPGDELSMTMILDDVEAEEGFCPYKSCGTSTADVPAIGGGKFCPNCHRFAAISEKNRPGEKIQDRHGTPRFSAGASASDWDVEPLASRTADSEEKQRANLFPAPLPQTDFYEEEDIELYYSIQVAQILLMEEYEAVSTAESGSNPTVTSEVQTTDSSSPSAIQIFVREEYGKTSALHVDPYDPVDYLKDKFEVWNSDPYRERRLVFAGKQLESGRTFADYNIQKHDTLHLRFFVRPRFQEPLEPHQYIHQSGMEIGEGMTIFVKTLTGKKITLKVKNDDKVLKIKELILGKEGIPCAAQRLIFGGRQIQDDETIYSCNIQKESVVHVILRLRGLLPPNNNDSTLRHNSAKRRPRGRGGRFLTPAEVAELELNTPSILTLRDEPPGRTKRRTAAVSYNKDLCPAPTSTTAEQDNSSFEDRDTIDLRIRDLHMNKYDLKAKLSDTIGYLKGKIEGRSGIPAAEQKLAYMGNTLTNDEKTLADYGADPKLGLLLFFDR